MNAETPAAAPRQFFPASLNIALLAPLLLFGLGAVSPGPAGAFWYIAAMAMSLVAVLSACVRMTRQTAYRTLANIGMTILGAAPMIIMVLLFAWVAVSRNLR